MNIMPKEYQDSIREGFEVYIAKQLKLETISKEVLAVQVFAMKGQEYADKKLQLKWGEWEAACSQQVAKDAGICKKLINENPIVDPKRDEGIYLCEWSILNQV